MAHVLLVSLNGAYSYDSGATVAAMEEAGHTVSTFTIDQAEALDAATLDTFDVFATVFAPYMRTATFLYYKAYSIGKPVLMGGIHSDLTGMPNSPHASSDFIGTNLATSTDYDAPGSSVVIPTVTHPVFTGFAVGAPIQVRPNGGWEVTALQASVGIGHNGAGSTFSVAAADIGDPIAHYPGYFHQARNAFLGWMYGNDYTAAGKTIIGNAVSWLAGEIGGGPVDPEPANTEVEASVPLTIEWSVSATVTAASNTEASATVPLTITWSVAPKVVRPFAGEQTAIPLVIEWSVSAHVETAIPPVPAGVTFNFIRRDSRFYTPE